MLVFIDNLSQDIEVEPLQDADYMVMNCSGFKYRCELKSKIVGLPFKPGDILEISRIAKKSYITGYNGRDIIVDVESSNNVIMFHYV